MDIRSHNRAAWNTQVARRNLWTIPVSSETIASARQGRFQLLLTPTKTVPGDWFPELRGKPVLCLASGGGQQGPVLAAAGALVTVFDNSPAQLAQDRFVADRDGLNIQTVEGDMPDLSVFSDESFEMIFHPCSNCFTPDVRPVWRECHRVLRSNGVLLAGFTNPLRYLFEHERAQEGSLAVRYTIPYSDLRDLTEEDRKRLIVDPLEPLEFGHTLADQIGGQLEAGFVLTGFFEDRYPASSADPISRFINSFVATRAFKA
ncbi:MAG: class I SAM-dependent methyltransferase [Planctomycetaceae bacterium]